MKKLLLFMIACTLGLFGTVNAQEYVIVGDGSTASQNVPIKADYEYSLTQQIYLQEEIGTGAGTITSIGFQGSSNLTKANVTIYMVNTEKSSFALTNGDFVAIPESSKVYEGSLAFKKDDWNELTLQTPFNYTGGNLMLCVYDHTGTYVSVSPTYKAFTATDGVMRTAGVFSYNAFAEGFENGGTISGTSSSFWDMSQAYDPATIYVTRNQVRFGFIASEGGEEGGETEELASEFTFDFEDGTLTGLRAFAGEGSSAPLWAVSNDSYYSNGTNVIFSESYDDYTWMTYASINNYIVTENAYAITAGSKLSWYVRHTSYNAAYADVYEVVVSEDGENFTQIWSGTAQTGVYEQELSLAEYAGKNLYIGFRHYCVDEYGGGAIVLDNFTLTAGEGGEEPETDRKSVV